MGAIDLIFKLRNDGYSISADGGYLDICPADDLSSDLVRQLKQGKPEILCALHREEELRRLVHLVADHHMFTQDDRDEAMHYAMLDQINALACFADLAHKAGLMDKEEIRNGK